MVDHANVSRPNVRTAGPITGIALKAPAVMLRTYQTFHTYGVFNDGGYQNQTCQQANYNCIPEYTGHGNQRLSGRVSCCRTCVNDRSRAQTGFVCEQTTGYAGTDTSYYCCTNKAAACCCRVECALYDCCESCGNMSTIDYDRLRYNLRCTDLPSEESAFHIPWRWT